MVPLRPDTPRRRPADGLRRWAPVLPVAVALLLWALVPLTVERLPTPDPRARAGLGVDRGHRALLDAWDDIDRAALALAADPLVQRAALGDPPDALAGLVERFAAAPLPAHTGVEVWRDSVLLAWQGRADTGPATPADGLVDSGERLDLRRTVALPGVGGGRVVVTRTVRQVPPVRNAFLRPYDLVGEATRTLDLAVRLDTARIAPGDRAAPGVPVAATLDDGRRVALGHLHVDVPRSVSAARRADDVRAFWGAVAVFALAIAVGRRWRDALRRRHGPVAGWTLAFVGTLGLVRAVLLALDVPGRWQRGAAPLAPLFDPERFATPVGAGLARSLGDLLLTVAVGLAVSWVASRGLALACVRAGAPGPAGAPVSAGVAVRRPRARLLVAAGAALAAGAATLLATHALAVLARRALLDSTLALFSRAALWPGRDVTLLLAALLGATLALLWTSRALAAGARLAACRSGLPDRFHTRVLALGGAAGVALAALGLRPAPEMTAVAMCVLAVGVWPGSARRLWPGSLRGLLPAVLLVAALLYALLAGGLATQRQMQMDDAAGSVERDARVLFDLTDVLRRAREDSLLHQTLGAPPDSARRARLDAAAAALVRDALLGSYGPFDIGLVVFDREGRIAGRYAEGLSAPSDALDLDEFGLLRAMQTERDSSGRTGALGSDPDLLVEPVTGRREADRFQYLGLARLDSAGYVTARAEPAPRTRDFETPFPRVLLPDGAAGLASDLAVAQFRDGAFVRGLGQDFGRVRLGDDVAQALATATELWRTEVDRTGRYRVLYRRQTDDDGAAGASLPDPSRVVAVRAPMLTVFDHLYYALRLALIGLALTLVPVAIALARHRGPWRPRHFRDRVLGAFLAVGGAAVVAVALVGRSVVVGEQARSTDAWLAQSLERVEETLTLDAPAGALAYRQLERTSIDSLARRLDLDLNVYRGPTLVGTSRPVLLRDGLLDPRLPAAAYEVLGFQGQRFVALDARLGTFRYRAGYRALLDESGRPVYVLSVPTLPEQERMEAEQARMQAYLFGALLVLLVLLLATATLLARALARPIARLREGLQTVAGGRFDTPLPVDRDDEMGDLARTFNAMQAQLAESRRQLTQQERQLAWREMARQVAHEIKNPLTPMKLSVQHLRRAYDDTVDSDIEVPSRFARMFDRVTTTLLEQIDALTRIASDFSTFARLPRRVAEPLDLSRVAAQAAELMQAEDAGAEVTLALAPEPLVVSADREEMRRVFINLVKNAIQATEGRDVRRVVVTSRTENGEAVVDVADTGTGIAEGDRERIFVPNFSTKTSGTGLGLAIARQAVEASGGTIAFETTEGAGSTFTVRLPLLAPDAP